jgi:hypothetical protein
MCSDGKKRQRSCNVGKVKEFGSSIRLKRKESKEILTLGWSWIEIFFKIKGKELLYGPKSCTNPLNLI